MKNCKVKIVLILSCICLILTSCGGLDKNVREKILKCVEQNGYIEKGDKLKYTSNVVSDAVPTIMAYDYIYDRDGNLYSVRIATAEGDEEQYEVQILYDVQIDKYSGKDEKSYTYKVGEYGSCIKLIVNLKDNSCRVVE